MKTVVFLIYDSFEALDVYGPLSVFASKQVSTKYEVTTVSQQAGPVRNSYGVSTVAQYDFKSCPTPDILVIPGGIGTRQEVANAVILDFIRERASPSSGKDQSLILTVCTGAALAAKAGILKGKQATTNKAAWAWATAQGEPGSIDWQKKARWVQDGNVWTSAGVTAGIDMALAFIADSHGLETAEVVARYLEYTGDFKNADNDPFWHIIDQQ